MFAFQDNFAYEREALPAPRTPKDALRAISHDQRDQLTEILDYSSEYLPDFMRHLTEALESPSVRDPVIAVVLSDPRLLADPRHRVTLLTSLEEYADEPLVQIFATRTLCDPRYKDDHDVLHAASKTILATSEPLTTPNIRAIANLAMLRDDADESLASLSAGYILQTLPSSTVPDQVLQDLARSCYLFRRGDPNPWLPTVSLAPSMKRVALLEEILVGNVPYEGKPTLLQRILTFPIDLHHTAVTSGLVGVIFNKALPLLGIGRGISSLRAFLIASTIVYGAKSIANAISMDAVNMERDPERLEAVRHLKAIYERALESSDRNERAAGRFAYAVLRRASRSLLQEPIVRAAARAAIEDIRQQRSSNLSFQRFNS